MLTTVPVRQKTAACSSAWRMHEIRGHLFLPTTPFANAAPARRDGVAAEFRQMTKNDPSLPRNGNEKEAKLQYGFFMNRIDEVVKS